MNDRFEKIAATINSPYLQQFLANRISVYNIRRALGLEREDLVLHHAYPRAGTTAVFARPDERADEAPDDPPRPLTQAHLEMAETFLANGSATTLRRLEEETDEEADAFAKTIDEIQSRQVIPSSIDLSMRIDDCEKRYPEFNALPHILRLDDLLRLCAAAGTEVQTLDDLALLSLCATVPNRPGARFRVFTKESLHPALRDFLIAHELGHIWLHMDAEGHDERRDFAEIYLRSAHGWGHLENEADSVALIILFPTPYLAWCEVEGRLDVQSIVDDLLSAYEERPDEHLLERIRQYVKKRLASYGIFKTAIALHRHMAMLLGNHALPVSRAVHAMELMGPERCWILVGADDTIENGSETFARLFGMTHEEVLARRMHLAGDFAEPAQRERLAAQRRAERRDVKPQLFFPVFRSPATGDVFRTSVQSYPIVDDAGDHAGSLIVFYDVVRATAEAAAEGKRPEPRQMRLYGDRIDPRKPAVDPATEERFRRLVEEWREQSGVSSDAMFICTLPSYQQIIGMGTKALPLILRELRVNSWMWTWALNAITGRTPVKSAKSTAEIVDEWLRWGEENGYL